MPFSYKSLIEQLKYEGYSSGDATYAASHSGANWYKEAVADGQGLPAARCRSRGAA